MFHCLKDIFFMKNTFKTRKDKKKRKFEIRQGGEQSLPNLKKGFEFSG